MRDDLKVEDEIRVPYDCILKLIKLLIFAHKFFLKMGECYANNFYMKLTHSPWGYGESAMLEQSFSIMTELTKNMFTCWLSLEYITSHT